MASGGGEWSRWIAGPGGRYLESFKLYETRSKFYVIGKDKSWRYCRMLKIDRAEPSKLNIHEDFEIYSKSESNDLLQRIHAGNISTGGLKFITKFYGIIGFVKFHGPYYMLIVTERRKLGAIFGHEVYAIGKREMIALSNCTAWSNRASSKIENRYKKLLSAVDLTKDFFFSYSYNIMCSIQRNICDGERGHILYETMFVWNEFLTHKIRNQLQNTLWTVALVFGFFEQVLFSVSGKEFKLTLIARRSRHFAGTRYLKRGVNEKGRVANDVETEQIVCLDPPKGMPVQLSSIVQNRGSIPLFWSQEASWRNLKPDIILLKKGQNYEATRAHFDNLISRYGIPIVILNLIRGQEKKPRESKLCKEFRKAIEHINKDLLEASRLRYLHFDLRSNSLRKGTDMLEELGKLAAYALNLTGFFYCQMIPAFSLEGGPKSPIFEKDEACDFSCNSQDDSSQDSAFLSGYRSPYDVTDMHESEFPEDKTEDSMCFLQPPMLQSGVLRTNCIDCLDRTNAAQYAYGLAALGHQLSALGLVDMPEIASQDPLANDLMELYERMGDTLALQYGGSPAHNKIFSERRGQWKAAIQYQELFRVLQRYYSNTYLDAEKQDAINLFLGHFQPEPGKPALWEMDSDQHYNIGRHDHIFSDENARSFIKRSFSDGDMVSESETHASLHQSGDRRTSINPIKEISECGSDFSFLRQSSMIHGKYLLGKSKDMYMLKKHGSSSSNCSHFLDSEWFSSSGNSCEGDSSERTSVINSSIRSLQTFEIINDNDDDDKTPVPREDEHLQGIEATESQLLDKDPPQNSDVLSNFSKRFTDWVAYGEAFWL